MCSEGHAPPLCGVFVAGVIAGIVSYFIAFVVTKVLDYGSSKTNGLFGKNAAREDVHEIDGPKVREQTFRIHANKTSDDSSNSSDDGQAAKVHAANAESARYLFPS